MYKSEFFRQKLLVKWRKYLLKRKIIQFLIKKSPALYAELCHSCGQYWVTCVIHFIPRSITKLFRFTQYSFFIQLFLKQASMSLMKKAQHFMLSFVTLVGNTGFEPVTSCLSSKRSKPTELIAQKKSFSNHWSFVGDTGFEPVTPCL